ncbi:hypothetical protein HN51_015058 [Arachis hypogaea]
MRDNKLRIRGSLLNQELGINLLSFHILLIACVHVRVEHVMPSRCTEEFRLRKINNDKLKAEAKANGQKISTKR